MPAGNGPPSYTDFVKILERLVGVETQLSIFVDEFKREREGASAHRQDLRIVIAAQSQSVQDLTRSVDHLVQEIAEIKPIIEDYQERRAEAAGAAKLGKILWAAIVAASAGLGTTVGYFLNLRTH